MSEAKNINPNRIDETAVLWKRVGNESKYFIVAKTEDGFLYEFERNPQSMDAAIMWADMLEGTMMLPNEWVSLVKVM